MRRLFVALFALAIGCARSGPETEVEPKAEAMIRVDNQAFEDMAIYIIRGTERHRIGLVTGHTVQTIPLLPAYIDDRPVRFRAEPIAGTHAPVSDEVTVRPGDIVELTIPPQ